MTLSEDSDIDVGIWNSDMDLWRGLGVSIDEVPSAI